MKLVFSIFAPRVIWILLTIFFWKKKLDIALARLFHAIQHQHDGSIISEAVKNTVPKLIDLNSATKERLLEKIQEPKVVNYLYYYCAYLFFIMVILLGWSWSRRYHWPRNRKRNGRVIFFPSKFFIFLFLMNQIGFLTKMSEIIITN